MLDRELQELRRRVEAEPDDDALAVAYDRGLLRAGREDEARARIASRLRCERPWSALDPDPRSLRLRGCAACGRAVRLVRDERELGLHAAAGRPVAASSAQLERLVDREVSALLDRGQRAASPPCVIVARDDELGDPAVVAEHCGCLAQRSVMRFHDELQDTTCDAWTQLLDLIERAARDRRKEFAPRGDMDAASWTRIVTLPPSIGALVHVRRLELYGSHLVRLPLEIGRMASLADLDPYTSYRLHWFPYELTRCARLRESCVSTRALYGNFKFRPVFPDLEHERGPAGPTCSVCDRPAPRLTQVWTSQRVGKDVLPLLASTCSQACIDAIPSSPDGYVPRPHRGGSAVAQPPRL